MKYVAGLILGVLTFSLILFVNQSEQELAQLSESEKPADVQNTQYETVQIVPAMKPAWYRYFNPHIYEENAPQKPVIEINKAKSNQQFISLHLVNYGKEALSIPTQNGSLIMIQEAKDPEGNWKPIEYWDYQWRDESNFDALVLAHNKGVEIQAPRYQGGFSTQVRFKLKIGDKANNMLYSEVIEAKIDPQQFYLNPEIKAKKKKVISYLN